MSQPPTLERELESRTQDAEAVGDATSKVDRRRILKVFGRTGDFSDAKAEMNALREHLVIKNEVVGIFEQGQASENLFAECPIPRVVLGEFDFQEQIFKRGQEAV